MITLNPRKITANQIHLAQTILEARDAVKDIPAGFAPFLFSGLSTEDFQPHRAFGYGFVLGVISRNSPGHAAEEPNLKRIDKAASELSMAFVLSRLYNLGMLRMWFDVNGEVVMQLMGRPPK